MVPDIKTEDYHYDLPQDRIAQYPLEQRDASKLLVYRDGECRSDHYHNISEYLPVDSLMVFNNSKVIPARVLYVKETSGVIELFCLEPLKGTPYEALQDKGKSVWVCMVGGLKKWRTEKPLQWNLNAMPTCVVQASFIKACINGYVIEFSWTDHERTFADILSELGQMPIPPYLLRKAEADDQQRYQTVYASVEGSVAAPTAGLHFTEKILSELKNKNIQKTEVTLHVGAGTFKPVNAEYAHGHSMHAEWIEADHALIEQLSNHEKIICVGTTSLRSIESLYWFAIACYEADSFFQNDFILPQFFAYEDHSVLTRKEAFKHLLKFLVQEKRERILFRTELMILPGYEMKVASYLVTNFHQPKSTLLMLVDAFTNGNWKTIYDYALKNDYRFLSYGDGGIYECHVAG